MIHLVFYWWWCYHKKTSISQHYWIQFKWNIFCTWFCGLFQTCGGWRGKRCHIQCKQILPALDKNCPLKTLTDVVLFGGSSNSQKSDQISAYKYPRISILHGVKENISIFFYDVSNIPAIKILINKRTHLSIFVLI